MTKLNSCKSKVDFIFNELKSGILSGKYASGAFLPPERTLTDQLDVSRGTLRKALDLLRDEGLVRINPGRGVFVTINSSESQKRLRRFMVCCPESFNFFNSLESMLFIKGIFSGAAELNAEMIMSFFSKDNHKQTIKKIIESYSTDNIDGVIYYDCADYEQLLAPLIKASVPYVVGNLEFPHQVVSVKMDFRRIAREAIHYLHQLGHTNIAIITGHQNKPIYNEFAAGFRGIFAEEELHLPAEHIIISETSEQASLSACRKFLANNPPPTAFFTVRDARAAGCMTACKEQGLRIPEDISLLSYDGVTWPDAKHHGLTYIEQPAEETGRNSVELLAKWISTNRPPKSIILPGIFREGKTCMEYKI